MRRVKEKTTASNGQNKTINEIQRKIGCKKLAEKDLSECNQQWLVDSFLVKGDLTMLYATAGNGKSYFVLYLSNFFA